MTVLVFSSSRGGNVPFADLRRIEGLNGIYVATKVISATQYSSTVNQVTLMSFNKGGDWNSIPAPVRNSSGNYTCGRTSSASAPQVEARSRLFQSAFQQFYC